MEGQQIDQDFQASDFNVLMAGLAMASHCRGCMHGTLGAICASSQWTVSAQTSTSTSTALHIAGSLSHSPPISLLSEESLKLSCPLLAKKKWRIETNFCDECNSIFFTTLSYHAYAFLSLLLLVTVPTFFLLKQQYILP
jgi:hypothetical protein